MSVNWKDESSPARLKAHAAACASGEFDHTVPTWDIYCDLREALIWGLLAVGFPPRSSWGITDQNWEEIYCRLQILERVTGCKRRYRNGNRKPRDMYFQPEEIRSMIGLSVNAGNKSNAEFKAMIWRKLKEEATDKLNFSINPPERRKADPYYWENLFAPKVEA